MVLRCGFFFSSRTRHTRSLCDWSSDVCSSDLTLFTRDPAVAPVAVVTLRTISYGFLFYAYGMVITQSFNGAGDTWTPTWINLGCFWLWEVPLAYGLEIGRASCRERVWISGVAQ